MEATRKLRFHKSELIWLAGNTFYGTPRHLRARISSSGSNDDFRLSDFELSVEDGQLSLTFRRPVDRRPPCGRSTRSRPSTSSRRAPASSAHRTGTRHSLRARQDAPLGKDGAPPRRSRPQRQRLRHPPPPQLSLAGVRREGHERRARTELCRQLQHLISPTSTILKPSAPMRTSCPWPWPRWPNSDEELKIGAVPHA